MTVNDIADSLGASLIAPSLGQSERNRSPAVGGGDAVGQAFERGDRSVEQQQASSQVSLSAFGQLRSSVAQLQESSASLRDNENTNTPEEARAVAQNFVNAFNNAQSAARDVTNDEGGALADDGRAAVAASEISRMLDDNSREQLRQIGINRNQDGTLSIDQQRFQQALQNDPQRVSDALADVGRQVQEATTRQLDGQIDRAVNALNSQAETLASQQAQQEAAQQAAQREQDQAAQQVRQQTRQQAADVLNAIAASGIATYQKIFAL